MNNRMFTATAVLAMASLLASGQTAPTPPAPAQMANNMVARLSRLLDLSSTQQQQAAAMFTTEETALASIRTSMQTARTALQKAVKANDAAGINTQAAAIGSLTTQEVQARATAQAAFYAILTPDQQSKYEAFGMRGPGLGGIGRPRLGGTH